MEILDDLKLLWQRNKPLVIVMVVGIVAILYYLYKQNNSGQGTVNNPTSGTITNSPNMETPTVETEQLSTILGALGKLTPVTNSTSVSVSTAQNTNTINTITAPPVTTTLTSLPVTTTITNTASAISQSIMSGIGNDTARDAAILAAEQKYQGASNAAALHAAIAAIDKQYPRSGPTT